MSDLHRFGDRRGKLRRFVLWGHRWRSWDQWFGLRVFFRHWRSQSLSAAGDELLTLWLRMLMVLSSCTNPFLRMDLVFSSWDLSCLSTISCSCERSDICRWFIEWWLTFRQPWLRLRSNRKLLVVVVEDINDSKGLLLIVDETVGLVSKFLPRREIHVMVYSTFRKSKATLSNAESSLRGIQARISTSMEIIILASLCHQDQHGIKLDIIMLLQNEDVWL